MTHCLRGAGPATAVLVLALLAACATARPEQAIVGTWLVEDIGGNGVVDTAQSIVEFDGEGGVFGSGGCNRYRGPVTVGRDSVQFGLLIATRRACPPALMDQEERFLIALSAIKSYRIDGPFLLMSNDAGEEVMTLTRLQ